MTNIAVNSAVKLYGDGVLIPMEKLTVSEDFTYFMDKVPGAFVFLGCGNEELGIYANHNDKFMVDEKALHKGAALYAQFALDFLDIEN